MPPAANSAAAAPANEPLLLRHDDRGIVTLTLNRPRQYNALCDALLSELQTQFDAIAADAAIRIVVIAGAGQAMTTMRIAASAAMASNCVCSSLSSASQRALYWRGRLSVSVTMPRS